MDTFTLRILVADHTLYEGECTSLVFPCVDGQIGIEANHANFISAVDPGVLKYRKPDGEVEYASVSNGMLKVEKNDVLVLVNTAERPEDIDAARARRAAEEARQQLMQRRSIHDHYMASMRIKRELSRVKLKEAERE